MVARFFYALVALFFLLASIASWLAGAGLFAAQLMAGPDGTAFVLAIWGFVLGPFLLDVSRDAWRAARY